MADEHIPPQAITTCWLCEDLGAIAVHGKWSAEHGRAVWVAHKPTSRTHPVHPCPACEGGLPRGCGKPSTREDT